MYIYIIFYITIYYYITCNLYLILFSFVSKANFSNVLLCMIIFKQTVERYSKILLYKHCER